MAKRKVAKGKKIAIECLREARNSLNLFSEDELSEYLVKVFNKADDYPELSSKAALERATKDVNQQELADLFDRAADKAMNIQTVKNIKRRMREGANTYNFLHPTLINKDFNAENAQRAANNTLYSKTFDGYDKDEIHFFETGKYDTEIANVADGKKPTNPNTTKWGKTLEQYPGEIRNPELVRSRALLMSEIRQDRYLRNIHNPQKLLTGGQSLIARALGNGKVDVETAKKLWVDKIKKTHNIKEMFKNTDAMWIDKELNIDKVDEVLLNTYDNIVHQRSHIFTRSPVRNDAEAVEKSLHMFFIPNNWSDFVEYNKEYGQGTLYQALLSDIRASGNKIGLAEIFGSSPDSAFNSIKKYQQKLPDIQPGRKRMSLMEEGRTDRLYQQIRGYDKTAWSPTLANIGASLRTWSSMSRLGLVVINSLNDISQVAGIAQRFGYSYWSSYTNALVHALNMFPNEGRQKIAKMLQSNLQAHQGYMGRYNEATNIGDLLSKASNTFYWANFTQAWDKGLKISGAETIARGLGRDSVKKFSDLGEQTRSQLQRFNLNESEWDGLRSKVGRDRLFTTDTVDALSDSELRSMWEKSDKMVPFSGYRSHVFRKVYGFFDAAVSNSVLDPRAFERMIATWGNIPPGTVSGELVRSFMQFKSYPIATFHRVWYQGMSEMTGPQAKLMYATNMLAGNLMLGYMSSVLGAYAVGMTPPDPTRMNNNEKLTYFSNMMAGGIGSFLRVIDPKMQRPDLAINMLFTPSIRVASEPLIGIGALATGNFKAAKNLMLDFAKYSNPIGTVPIIEPYLDQLMGKEPYKQPGQEMLNLPGLNR